TGKASNDPGGLPHVPGGDGRAEHRHGARPYRCLPNPSPGTRHREVLPMTTTDTDALEERIARELFYTESPEERHRDGWLSAYSEDRYLYRDLAAAVLPIVAEEV